MHLLTGILDFLFPPRCAFCHGLLKSGEREICSGCENSLPRTSGGGRQKGDFFAFCLSPLYYRDEVRSSIHRYKFGGCEGYAKTYGRLVAECIKENLDEEYDLITWAPLSRKRLRKRGYDQALLLARAVSRELGAGEPVRTLKKREVPAQSSAGDEARRRANISGAYSVLAAEPIEGKTLLLIDDVITTGATVSECARVLRMSGAERVICATLARAGKKG